MHLPAGVICKSRLTTSNREDLSGPCGWGSLAINNAYGILGLPPGGETEIIRMSNGDVVINVTPSIENQSNDCADSGHIVFQPTKRESVSTNYQSWCDEIFVIIENDKLSGRIWIASNAVTELVIGKNIPEGASLESPTILSGSVEMRGQSLFRDLLQWAGKRPRFQADLRWLIDLGTENLLWGDEVYFCCSSSENRVNSSSVLRIQINKDGMKAIARLLASSASIRSSGGLPRVLSPTRIDRLRDPAFGWIVLILAVSSTFSFILKGRK